MDPAVRFPYISKSHTPQGSRAQQPKGKKISLVGPHSTPSARSSGERLNFPTWSASFPSLWGYNSQWADERQGESEERGKRGKDLWMWQRKGINEIIYKRGYKNNVGKKNKKQHAECQNNNKRRIYWLFIIFPHLLTLADRKKNMERYYLYITTSITINI